MDTKKKELIGNFRNPGAAWGQKAEPVNQHDFRSYASAIASPYGLFEPLRNRGTIVIGVSSDTPRVRRRLSGYLDTWISEFGWTAYPGMKDILLLCDCVTVEAAMVTDRTIGSTAFMKPWSGATALR